VRATIAGLRLASWADGTVRAAPGRLPADPGSVVALPERLGGGFLFAVGPHLWRSDNWLGPASPAFASPFQVADVLVGLDRAYARSPQGTLVAFDPRTGESLDLGPVPPAPRLGRLAAVDAWRAVAIADMRGALVTLDAGSSWRPLGLPIEPSEVIATGDVIAVGGPDQNRQVQWWAVGADGQPGRLSEAPARFVAPKLAPRSADALARIFRPRPLVAAIEDGWPLVDGTALVARDGALVRVRLTDGAIVESALSAFPLNPARCHAVSLARPSDPGAVGFVCGEPRGRTVVYRWDAPRSRLIELRRFDEPREVLAFGNGALAARGPCSADSGEKTGADQAYCLMPPGGPWAEMRFRGDDADLARVVVIADGRVALVRPPRAGDLATASLTVTDGIHTDQHALSLPPVGSEIARALRLGLWMDGFEERRPGVLGGWVDAAGALVGVEIALDGTVRIGEYIRDEGAPVASGRWALGWTASRRGFETTDGGMTWTKGMDLPPPVDSPDGRHERACGPVGCIAAGWLRIGWGGSPDPPLPAFPPPRPLRPGGAPSPLHLDCQPAALRPLEPPPSPARSPSRREAAPPLFVLPLGSNVFYGPGSTTGTVSEFPSFCGRPGPRLPADERGFIVEVPDFERYNRLLPPGALHAWGPVTGDWDRLGRWEARWQWPWGGCSSAAGPAPWPTLDAARHALGKGIGAPTSWVVAAGDDADHALFIARRTIAVPTADVVEVEAGQAPVQVRRPGGDPFPEIDGAIRMSGRWYLVTVAPQGELPASVLWAIDGPVAREVARVPRAGSEIRPPPRLAAREGGRSLGLAMDGQPRTDGPALIWVTSVDLDTGIVGEPDPIAPVDLSDRRVTLCTGDDAGWRLAMPYPGSVEMTVGRTSTSLKAPVARMRISHNGACLESILGSWDEYASPQILQQSPRPRDLARGPVRAIDAGVFSSGKRFPLLCSQL
jgi:hypothetical protein